MAPIVFLLIEYEVDYFFEGRYNMDAVKEVFKKIKRKEDYYKEKNLIGLIDVNEKQYKAIEKKLNRYW